jgi:hypothetical protein
MSQTLTGLTNLIAISQGKQEDLLYLNLLREQILAVNAVLIEQKITRDKFVAPNFVQTIKCVKLKTVLAEECSIDLPFEKVLRTVNKVPRNITWKKKTPFLSIYNSMIGNSRIEIPFANIDMFEFNKFRRFTNKNVVYLYDSDYIYIVNAIENDLPIEEISIRLIANDPIELKNFATNEIKDECECTDCKECANLDSSCFTDSGDYTLDNILLPSILSFFGNGNSNSNKEQQAQESE